MKSVLITGAGRGIGLALCREFLAGGFKVIGTYRTKEAAEELLQLAQEKKLTAVKADVGSASGLSELKDFIKKNGSPDILINNSGVIGQKSISLVEMNIENLHSVFDVNTLGPMRVSQIAAPLMTEGSTIANITSLMGSIADNGSGGYYDYRMSKAALNMFNKCLALEFKHLNCIVLHPGWVQTDMGGAGANVSVKDCASGLYSVITGPKANKSGAFWDYKGKELPW